MMDKTVKSDQPKNGIDRKPKEEIPILSEMQTSSFNFWNGDEYTGEFTVLKDKQKIVMEGEGIYKTADNQIYEGIWEGDCLKEATRITFPDKSVFCGNLEEMVIQGPGKYKFKENVEIEGEFVDNHLIGNVILTDPNQHLWKGEVDEDQSFFYPLHSFWQSVLSLPSKTEIFYGEAGESYEEEEMTVLSKPSSKF